MAQELSEQQMKLLLDIQSRLIRIEEYLTSNGTRLKIDTKFERKGNFKESKKKAIIDCLKACGGDKQMTCRTMGISRSTLWRVLKEAI